MPRYRRVPFRSSNKKSSDRRPSNGRPRIGDLLMFNWKTRASSFWRHLNQKFRISLTRAHFRPNPLSSSGDFKIWISFICNLFANFKLEFLNRLFVFLPRVHPAFISTFDESPKVFADSLTKLPNDGCLFKLANSCFELQRLSSSTSEEKF